MIILLEIEKIVNTYIYLFSFSLTLVDSLDTLVVMGDIEEFDRALRLVVRDVTFDHDVVVSVFETNIRMVGGLISGHVLAEHLNQVIILYIFIHICTVYIYICSDRILTCRIKSIRSPARWDWLLQI